MTLVMKRNLLCLMMMLFFINILGFSQNDTYSSLQTTMDGRYEIIQSPIARKLTFKIDKVEGNVWQLVQTSSGGVAWQTIHVALIIADDKEANSNNYRFFFSGIALKDCFIYNVKTGRCWVLVESSNKELSFEPFY